MAMGLVRTGEEMRLHRRVACAMCGNGLRDAAPALLALAEHFREKRDTGIQMRRRLKQRRLATGGLASAGLGMGRSNYACM